MTKMNLSAPLPFVGQKRMFAKEFIKVLEQFPDDTVLWICLVARGYFPILPKE